MNQCLYYLYHQFGKFLYKRAGIFGRIFLNEPYGILELM